MPEGEEGAIAVDIRTIRPDADTASAGPFWKRMSFAEMTCEEWESLCDGCAKCCLLKLEDFDTGEVHYTNVACRLLHPGTCRCTDYASRKQRVPDCVKLDPGALGGLTWLPSTCAYRLLYEGKDLRWWHPLLSGDAKTVYEAGISVRNRVVPEDRAHELEDHIVDWPV